MTRDCRHDPVECREDDHGPMDADAIGAAAAMEALKQTAAKAPAGGFKAGGAKPGRAEEEEEEEETTTARAGGSGGLQDKLVGGAPLGWCTDMQVT